MIWLSGKELARERRKVLRQKLKLLPQPLCLAVILVGKDPSSQIYVGAKENAAKKAGLHSRVLRLPEETSANALSLMIEDLNLNPSVHGILLQLPLPSHLNAARHLQEIDPQKDVDGFHPLNVGKMTLALPALTPCTPLGIMHLLLHYQIPLEGKSVAVVGKSNIVGRPMAQLLMHAGATVTVCHSLTINLAEHLRNADVIISAAGSPDLIGPECLGRPAYLIDVGINRLEDGTVCGDMQTQKLSEHPHCLGLTPVPGGVGPMTIQVLLENTYFAATGTGIDTESI
ncbi:MAG: bifunctional 5,10-methylenetetrahydrofolate dehydrogenase/5,10-methenyltetrahydrofolate cyclohydrolase [Candidatus Cloacimonetes bacterium]|nr:bifunctional 5,10-methylenetetrahydrofolate dehydrogenase/5,10-methenyltetrahydrofolate cyclohydrolase [Candidatus Cloacimonadota bacterium]